jgi:hypothetical protein
MFDAAYFQFARGFDDQVVMRFLQRKKGLNITEIVFIRNRGRRRRQYGYLGPAANLFRKIARRKAQQVMRHRNGVFVVIRSSMPHSIDHVILCASA